MKVDNRNVPAGVQHKLIPMLEVVSNQNCSADLFYFKHNISKYRFQLTFFHLFIENVKFCIPAVQQKLIKLHCKLVNHQFKVSNINF